MTFFLNEPTEAPKIKAQNPNVDLAEGWFDTVGAAVTSSQLETDANFIGRRTTIEAKTAKGWDLAERIGADRIEQRARERGMSDGAISTFTAMMKRRPPNMPSDMQALVFDLAQESATDDPDTWADVEFSDEAVLKEANEKLQAEHQEAQDILEMSPGGSTAARIIGGMIGITADIKNAPFLLMGGGQGSILRVMGREAMLNTAAEATFLPSQFEMAERLDIPDPNVAQQLALAAAAGGALGGIVEAGRRGITYFQMRNRTAQIPGYDPLTSQTLVDEAEDILTSDTPRPFEQIQKLQEETPQAPYRLENPLNPQRPPLIEQPSNTGGPDPVEAARKRLETAEQKFSLLDAEHKVSDLDAYLEASNERVDARNNYADALAERGGRIELTSKGGLGAAITPRMDGKQGFRITYFDQRGISGDTHHDTLQAAVRDAVDQGYVTEAPGSFRAALAESKSANIPDEIEAATAPVARPGDADAPPVTSEPLEPITDENLIETMQAAVDEARKADNSANRPLTLRLQRSGRGGTEILKIHPEGHVGQELKNAGITSKSAPGLFSKKGRKDFDNLVADEWEKEFPGIIEATGTPRGETYLDRDGFIELLRRDIEGDSSWLRSRAEVQRLEAELETYQREGDSSPTDDFIAGNREDSGFFVELDDYEFQHGSLARQRIADDLNAYLDETGQTFLTDAERAEILEELQSRGGDAEYLVERIAEREIELSTAPQPEDALDDIPFGDDAATTQGDVGSGRGGSERSSSDDGPESTGGTRTEDTGATRTEQTDAGEQIVAPGIEPVTQRQRLETQQSAPLRGGDAAADIGLFDTGARAQMDIFDNPAGTEARAIQDSITNDILSDIEANGPTEVNMALEDGRVLKTDQDVLAYLDEADRASAFFDLCGKGPSK